MGLLSDQDRQTVARHLADIRHPVTVLFFSQTIGAPETVLVTQQILQELVSLHPLLTLEEVNVVLEKERAEQYGIVGAPGIVLLRNGEDSRMRFLGAPAGYEFTSLVEALILAGTDESGLSADSKALVAAHVTGPIDIKVFVTPTCPHCPRAVTLAHKLAAESPHIRATCVEATEFMDLSRRYHVTGVPKTIINDTVEILGAVPEDAFVNAVVAPPPEEPPTGD